ncbi:MAG: hypothetical protein HGA49_10745 [Eubacteriaceae bacterium]|nr:hypothetical protein [Eubacteriaceae bacterium]
MYQEEFVPVSFKLKIKRKYTVNLKYWAEIMKNIFDLYAEEICKNNDCHIGHIKALFTGKEKDYIKLSIIKKGLPAETDFEGINKYPAIELIVNSIVSSVDQKMSLAAMKSACKSLEKKFQIKTQIIAGTKQHH